MPRYRVTNRITNETYEIEAPYAQDACELLGWQIGNCYVKLLREGPRSYLERNAAVLKRLRSKQLRKRSDHHG